MKKIYAQNDLQVVLQYFLEEGQHIALVVDKWEYVPYVKREIIHTLGQPSWDEGAVVRYSKPNWTIKMVSKASHDWEQRIRGMSKDSVYYVEGWNVDDVRHSPYCGCAKPDEAHGYYVSAEGKLMETYVCDECGRRIGSELDAIKYAEMSGAVKWTDIRRSTDIPKSEGKPPEFKQEYLHTWVEHEDE